MYRFKGDVAAKYRKLIVPQAACIKQRPLFKHLEKHIFSSGLGRFYCTDYDGRGVGLNGGDGKHAEIMCYVTVLPAT